MSTSPTDLASRAQAVAIRPELSVWVTASAGSGKTKVLTERVLALLLTGTAPSRILCLTFTKAAAAEMSNRINAKLAQWVDAPDTALENDLARLLQDRFTAAPRAEHDALLARARRLFAQVLDATGGLQISTLHAFCQSLLRRFPLEAKVPPHFDLMDERDAAEALDQALEHAIAEARDGADAGLGAALQHITARVHESHFADLMAALIGGRAKIKRMILRHGSVQAADAALRRVLGVAPTDTEESLIAAACEDSACDCKALRAAATALAGGSAKDQERGAALGAWLENAKARVTGYSDYSKAFLTAEGNVRATLATKAVYEAAPETRECLAKEGARLADLAERIRAVRTAVSSGALLRLGAQVLALFESEKQRRGVMDYDDLIQCTRALLSQPGIADWVLYKLDGGIDHILIDEAQDTNPEQWAIVAPIRDEFFAGAGRHDDGVAPRTVFAVGDRKQSIYSFQGASPDTFEAEHTALRDLADSAQKAWKDVTMNVSFRSTPAVIEAVNAVFAPASPARFGVAPPAEGIAHEAARGSSAGLVEVWPLVVPAPGDDEPGWKPPVERKKGDSPQNRLAAQVARRIHTLIGTTLESEDRPIRAGDIMVLVRRRTGFVDELVRQLKNLQVAVAGVDRMVLTEQIAIMDLMALGQFLLLPEDDLTLATLLKSPLIGLNEEELFTLAYNRGEKSIWDVLATHAGGSNAFATAHAFLEGLRARTDYLTPAELYGHVLVALDGRSKLLARLGLEADDPIDEFMNLALAYEKSHPPSLQGFLHWLAAGEIEIKRDLEQGADAVRIITVHGAKGLEAPIVILPDTAQVPVLRDAILWTRDATPLLLWCNRAGELDAVTTALREGAKEAQRAEYHRLLYVAMTRARDRLYVCGWQGKRASGIEETWYGLIRGSLASLPRTQTDGEILRLASPQTGAAEARPADAHAAAAEPLPAWARQPAPAEESPSRPLAPSRLLGEKGAEQAPVSPLKDDGRVRYQRGLIIHRLLQSLPELPAAAEGRDQIEGARSPRAGRRRAAAEAFVKRPAWGLDTAAQELIVTETLAVLDTPAFAPLFAPGSRAEVALSGLVGKHVIAAQIDRIAITSSEVWIVDYKTNRPPPREQAGVDAAYVLQMATYRAALQAIYPAHAVRCVLLWTDGPFTMELDAGMMDAALTRIL